MNQPKIKKNPNFEVNLTSKTILSVIICLQDSGDLRISERLAYSSSLTDEHNGESLLEILVVDASPDISVRKLNEQFTNSIGGRYFHLSNDYGKFSLSNARNIGAHYAIGDFLLFLDADLIHPINFMNNLLNFIRFKLNDFENYFAIIPVFYLEEGIDLERLAELRTRPLVDWMYGDASLSAKNLQLVNSTLLIRKSFYTLLGGQHREFRGWGMEDWHFLWKLMNFPQPIPGPASESSFHKNSPEKHNSLNTWRDAAHFVGDVALRSGLYLLHVPHPRRVIGWRSNTGQNERRFNTLINERIVFENTPELKTGPKYCVYSDDPVASNALLFAPNAAVRTGDSEQLKLRSDWASFDTTERPVIGGWQLDGGFFELFGRLSQSERAFDFVYPSGASGCVFYFSYEKGQIISPKSNTGGIPIRFDKTPFVEQVEVDATQFRMSGWRRDKFLPLFLLTDDRSETIDERQELDLALGLSAPAFRSMVNAMLPLFGPDVASMIHDTTSSSMEQRFPTQNAFDVSNQCVHEMICAADIVVTQSPRFALFAAIAGKPVITTGSLFADVLPELPVAQQLFDVIAFIDTMRKEPQIISREQIERAVARSCIFVADESKAPPVADLHRRKEVSRILYEQVATPNFVARYDFTFETTNTAIQAWYWPHLNLSEASQKHLAVTDDPWLFTDKKTKRKNRTATANDAHKQREFVLNANLAADPVERARMYRSTKNPTKLSRRLAKLKRDPHRYFADSSISVLRPLRHIFRAH